MKHSRLYRHSNGFFVDCMVVELVDDKRSMVKFNDGTKQIVKKKRLDPYNRDLEDKPWKWNQDTMSRFFEEHNKLKKRLEKKDKLIRKLQNKIITLKGIISSLKQNKISDNNGYKIY